MNQVNDQVRKRRKIISNVAGEGEEYSFLVDVFGCNDGISGIHGKDLSKQLSFHCEHDSSHTQTNVRHIYEIDV